MTMTIRNFISQFVAGLIGGIAGFITTAVAFNLLDKLNLTGDLWGDKGMAISGLLVGLPAGCIIGFAVVDRVNKSSSGGIIVLLLSLISGVIGSVFGIMSLVGKLGNSTIIVMPMIVVGFSMVGYHVGSLIKRL